MPDRPTSTAYCAACNRRVNTEVRDGKEKYVTHAHVLGDDAMCRNAGRPVPAQWRGQR